MITYANTLAHAADMIQTTVAYHCTHTTPPTYTHGGDGYDVGDDNIAMMKLVMMIPNTVMMTVMVYMTMAMMVMLLMATRHTLP